MKILILAAGDSKRFNSHKSKVLANFWGARVIDIIQIQASNFLQVYQEHIKHGEKKTDYFQNDEQVLTNKFLTNKIFTIVNEKIAPEVNGQKLVQDKSAYGTGAAVAQFYEYMKNSYMKNSNIEQDVNQHVTQDEQLNNLALKDFSQKHEKQNDNLPEQDQANEIEEDLLIIPADMPLIDTAMLMKFVQKIDEQEIISDIKPAILLGVMKMPKEQEQYGRIIIENGKIIQIAEYKVHPQKTEYANTGVLLIRKNALKLISQLEKNVYGEIFLTDIVEKAIQADMKIDMVQLDGEDNYALGFNTIQEFHFLLKLAQKKWRAQAIASGAILYDEETIYLSYDTQTKAGAIIEPYCSFGPGVKINSTAHVKGFSMLQNCNINGIVGPFAHIRSGEIEQDAQVGAFVEVSKSMIKKGAKIKHLAYVGNAYIGENANIAAGVTICNYDGQNKHETTIEDNVFVGANTALVAPIHIKNGAFLAAGGVYTDNVEENEFAIARVKQINKRRSDT